MRLLKWISDRRGRDGASDSRRRRRFGRAGGLVEELFGSSSMLRRLEPGNDIAGIYKRRIIRYSLTALTAALIGIVGGRIYDACSEPQILDGKYLTRAAPGRGDTSYELSAGDGETVRDVTVKVSEQRVYGEELEELFEKAYAYIEQRLSGDDPSTDEISTGVLLTDSIPGSVMTIEWERPDPDYFYSDGRVRQGTVTEPVVVILTATLTYFDEVRLRMIPVCLVPKEEKQETFDELAAVLRGSDMDQSVDGLMKLPEEVDGKTVTWEEKKDDSGLMLTVLGIVSGILIFPAGKAELTAAVKKREEQMLMDYPDIVSKFIMLTTAGMTCRGAWEKIVWDTDREKPCSGTSPRGSGRRRKTNAAGGKTPARRFAYEEMRVSLRELELGIPEEKVYEAFGDRCGLLPYQRFGTLLARNIRRGSRELNRLLELEAEDAFASRRERARVRSEELGTKLLLPMMIMMCIVIAVVIVPAFRTITL